ncbi:hypothetical protein BT63DRAFT_424373 [Microthyrium microscopicum]|uniref:Pre-rRNA-processing protein TSR2 n=1 Tax=Microthyrium microscopicum TaxID=703497 RepID=A0A6A6UF60_9PEZI|nr:hypothetical protein BT63DRAFT_424373 [Microthyrium microscopicum]
MATTTSSAPTPAQLQAKFDLGISLVLNSWEALTLAVQNQWGGNESADKRAWFAGALSEIFQSNPETDSVDLEEILLQVMEDEFEVAVEDGSEVNIAAGILQIKQELQRGNAASVDALWAHWKNKKSQVRATRVGPSSDDEDSVDDESDLDDDEDDEDESMEDVVEKPSRQKIAPEVDEDGFTKVVGRRR